VEPRDEAAAVSRTVVTRVGEPTPGSELLELGAPEGRQTPREDVFVKLAKVVRSEGSRDGDGREVLEGEGKAMSGTQPEGNTDRFAARRNTPRSRSQDKKDVGGAAKPDE
jgi:hypothetical protein